MQHSRHTCSLTPVGQLLTVNVKQQQLSARISETTHGLPHVLPASYRSRLVKYLAFHQSRRAAKPMGRFNAGVVHAKRMKSFFRFLLTKKARFEVPLSSAQSDTDADFKNSLLEVGSVTPLPEPLVGPHKAF